MTGMGKTMRQSVFPNAADYKLIIQADTTEVLLKTKQGPGTTRECDIGSVPFTKSAQRDQCAQCRPLTDHGERIASEFENACCVDFFAPYLETMIGVVYNREVFTVKNQTFNDLASHPDLVNAICLIFTWVGIFMVLFVALELFRDGEDFVGVKEREEMHESVKAFIGKLWEITYFSVVTFTTVGYGDMSPRSLSAKLLSMVYMMCSLLVSSYTIGIIASVVSIGSDDIYGLQGKDQLTGKVVCLPGYYHSWLGSNFNDASLVKDGFSNCLSKLKDGKVDAVVYDLPQIISEFEIKNLDMSKQAISEGIVFPIYIGWIMPDMRELDASSGSSDYFGTSAIQKYYDMKKTVQTAVSDANVVSAASTLGATSIPSLYTMSVPAPNYNWGLVGTSISIITLLTSTLLMRFIIGRSYKENTKDTEMRVYDPAFEKGSDGFDRIAAENSPLETAEIEDQKEKEERMNLK